ncbi:hypothetical protein CKAH01_03292 [Colletotrichum kahawae]|uniref:Uncharacterized protein n=1 Tax=Colletotrichum kahawae TaxID=34407 RepID=A0AAD9YR72_COLKA|nr:hypothetical protein CKAH01_03292 [Colletotrichum kahawae]
MPEIGDVDADRNLGGQYHSRPSDEWARAVLAAVCPWEIEAPIPLLWPMKCCPPPLRPGHPIMLIDAVISHPAAFGVSSPIITNSEIGEEESRWNDIGGCRLGRVSEEQPYLALAVLDRLVLQIHSRPVENRKSPVPEQPHPI